MEKPNHERPKLELALNELVRVKLLKNKPYEGNSPYGSYLLYSIEQAGVEKAFFAPPEVHQQITDLGCKAGDELTLKKIAAQNGRKVVSRIQVDAVEKPAPVVTAMPPASTQPASKPTNGQGLKDDFRFIMEQSLREAVEITRSVQGVPFQNEDIQKIASCLFIART
ncbi:MAG: hypothetical protein ACKVRP_03265 [Bacteroidota bacterium]